MKPKRINYRLWGVLSLLLLLCGQGFAQNQVLPEYNIFNDARLTVKSEKITEYEYKITLEDSKQSGVKKDFTLKPMGRDVFVDNFKRELKALLEGRTEDKNQFANKDTTAEAQRIFYYIQSAGIASAMDDAPVAGTIELSNEIDIWKWDAQHSDALEAQIEKFTIKTEEIQLAGETHKENCECVYRVGKDGAQDTRLECFCNKAKRKRAENYLLFIAEKELCEELDAQIKAKQKEVEALQGNLDSLATQKDKNQKARDELKVEDDSLQQFLDLINYQRRSAEKLWFEIDRNASNMDIKANKIIRSYDKDPGQYQLDFSSFGRKITTDKVKESAKEDIRSILSLHPFINRVITNLEIIDQNRRNNLTNHFQGISTEDKSTLDSLDWSYLLNYYSLQIGVPENIQSYKKDLVSRMVSDSTIVTTRKKLLADIRNYESKIALIENNLSSYQKQYGSLQELKKLLDKEDSSVVKEKKLINPRLAQIKAEIAELKRKKPCEKFQVDHVQMEFNMGFIERIVVYGNLENNPKETVIFKNVQPIGFSRNTDFDQLQNFELWTESSNNGGGPVYRMTLSDLVTHYEPKLALNRRDFSPADGTVEFDLSSGSKKEELKKKETYQLFEAKVFSDFVGFDDKAANGLIQTEVSKRIAIQTKRRGVRWTSSGGIKNVSRLRHWYHYYFNSGWIQYVEPMVTISKIESNNRTLVLPSRDLFVNNQYFQERYSSTLDIRNYENLSVGLDFNIHTLDLPGAKSTFRFDMGFRYGRTQVVDTIRAVVDGTVDNTDAFRDFGVNTFRWYPKIIWEFLPEERYGFSVSNTWNFMYLYSPDIEQVGVPHLYAQTGENQRPNRFNTLSMEAYFNPSVDNPTGKLFFRYSFNHVPYRWNTNFHQAQVGYSFFLLGRSKK